MAVKHRKFHFTGTGAIAASAKSIPGGCKFVAMLLHLSAGGAAANLTCTLNSERGAVYDTIFVTQAMSGLANYSYIPTNPVILSDGDAIDVAYANGAGTTYGLTIIFEEQ